MRVTLLPMKHFFSTRYVWYAGCISPALLSGVTVPRCIRGGGNDLFIAKVGKADCLLERKHNLFGMML